MAFADDDVGSDIAALNEDGIVGSGDHLVLLRDLLDNSAKLAAGSGMKVGFRFFDGQNEVLPGGTPLRSEAHETECRQALYAITLARQWGGHAVVNDQFVGLRNAAGSSFGRRPKGDGGDGREKGF